MRRYKVVTSYQAELDIENIYKYIAEDLENPYAAARQILKIRSKINSLHIVPERNHVYDNFYRVKSGHYRIVYQVESFTVYVIRVVGMRQSYDL